MSYPRTALRLVIFSLFLTVASFLGFAQKQKQSIDPQEKPRKVKSEPDKAFTDWVTKDVTYIITDWERKAYDKLTSNEERERFIEEFWRRRDPDPDTDENEFKEEYNQRIAYANEHFASGIPGWKTDRGRIWIMYGKPDGRETHPMGGSYDRPANEGSGSTTTYPFETWFYRYLPGVGSGIDIEFVDPTGSGEYRIARNANEKDALLMVPGAGQTLSEQLGLSNKADRIAGLGGNGMNGWQREQDSPFSRLILITDILRPPPVKFNDLRQLISTPVIEDNPLNFDLRVDFFRRSDERVISAFTIQTENRDLSFQESGGLKQASINIFGRITSAAGRRAGNFEDSVITTATTEELLEAKDRKSAYQSSVALSPGTYKIDVVVRDIASGATGVRHQGFTVPKYDPQKLSTSTLVLAAKLEGIGDRPAVGQFVIGQQKVIPNVARSYHRGQPVGVYLQVYNAGIDQTTLRPAIDVDYVLSKDEKELSKQPEDWRGMSDSGQRLTLARLLDTQHLAAGEYKLTIRIRDRVTGQTLAPSESFTVIQ
jgi:GWxTD domain-containing protein